jgi:hypothetical protein
LAADEKPTYFLTGNKNIVLTYIKIRAILDRFGVLNLAVVVRVLPELNPIALIRDGLITDMT